MKLKLVLSTVIILLLAYANTAYAVIEFPESVVIKEWDQTKRLYNLLSSGDFAELQKNMEGEYKSGYREWDAKSTIGGHIGNWRSYYSKSDEELIAAINKWIAAYPENTIPITAHGIVYYWMGVKARGSKWAKDTSKENFDTMKEHFDVAFDDLSKAVKIDPDNALAWTYLLNLSRNILKQEEREKIFAKAISNNTEYYWLYNSRLRGLLPKWRGKDGEALEFARYYAKNSKEGSLLPLLVVDAHDELAVWAKQRGDLKEERDESIVWKIYDMVRGKNKITTAKDYLNQPEVWKEITEAVEKVLKHNPKHIRAMLLYAELAKIKKDYKIAREYNQKAVDLEPFYGKTKDWRGHSLNQLGWYYKKEKKYDEALAYFNKHVEYFPDETYARQELAYIYSLRHQYQEQFPHAKILYEKHPDDEEHVANYCVALFNIHKYEEAIKYCNKAIEINPKYAYAYKTRAMIYSRIGKHDEAKADNKKHQRLQ